MVAVKAVNKPAVRRAARAVAAVSKVVVVSKAVAAGAVAAVSKVAAARVVAAAIANDNQSRFHSR